MHGGVFDVDVGAGVITSAGADTVFVADTATLDSEAVLDLRFDTISITAAGALAVTKGTVDSIAPAPPANNVLVAIVGVVKDALAIAPGDIHDCRILRQQHADDHPYDYVRDASDPLYIAAPRIVSVDSLLNLAVTVSAGTEEVREFDNSNLILVSIGIEDTTEGVSEDGASITVEYRPSTNAGKMKVALVNATAFDAQVNAKFWKFGAAAY